LRCHWCDRVEDAPQKCPQCGSEELVNFRPGTEKVEAAAQAAFYPARVARMDSDTMRSGEDYEEVLESFRRGKIDVLIGTQMIAKGLHFPNVTLVGVINPDIGLSIPDFRASERTFQLLAQVAGRAGRGDRRGEVIIQTSKPHNEVIRYAADLDFAGFKAFDFEMREALRYPPFGRLIALHFRGSDEDKVVEWAETIVGELQKYLHDDVILSGPFPSPIAQVNGRYRYIVSIRGERLSLLRQALRILALHRKAPRGVEFFIDVDAQSLL
jgi:primosomal protein N' (replication factor Y)